MKINSIEILQEVMDRDFAWRKKEMEFIVEKIQKSTNSKLNTYLRIAIVILYAHWEGFIKRSASCYLNFVSHQRISCKELKYNFIAIALKQKIYGLTISNKPSFYNEVVRFIIEELPEIDHFSYDKVVKTESNLSADIFFQIISQLGLDYTPYQLKGQLIDFKLVKQRHEVAHGNEVIIDADNFKTLYDEIVGILSSFKDQIIDSANSRLFLAKDSSSNQTF